MKSIRYYNLCWYSWGIQNGVVSKICTDTVSIGGNSPKGLHDKGSFCRRYFENNSQAR